MTAAIPQSPGAGRPDAQARLRFEAYTRNAAALRARHLAQTTAEAERLRHRHQQPVFGEVATWSLLEMMARVIDPIDEQLYCSSQETHMLQVIDAMAAAGINSGEFILAALFHDLGKVVALKTPGDRDETATFMPGFLAVGPRGAGLDCCLPAWSTDELAWLRLKPHLPPAVAWLVRYHGIDPKVMAPYMNAEDRDYTARYLLPFRQFDLYSKSPFARPLCRLEDFRPLVEQYLPPRIVF